ncbi:hypothetical protein DMN91_011903 [Ooceraea biroi]|uniref:THAP-type domain-containing protein n=2 Tax=Ooceraea biroi TaxID=2015173 RepID=A0A3L8D791_OOCBI|nr:hypothetical protein DMN91_011903 [Ooceraea biroi]
MTRYCYVCHVEQSVQNSHFIFHRIPSNPDRRKKWLEVLKKEKFNGVVCSQHFKPEDYRKLCDKQLLKPEAIPSLNIQ